MRLQMSVKEISSQEDVGIKTVLLKLKRNAVLCSMLEMLFKACKDAFQSL